MPPNYRLPRRIGLLRYNLREREIVMPVDERSEATFAMPRISYHAAQVLQYAGFPLDKVDAELVGLAERALEQCYYVDRSAEWLLDVLQARRSR